VACDAHAPERAGEWIEEQAISHRPSAIEEQVPSAERRAPSAALRLLETPEEVTVEFSDARPCGVWWRGERITLTSAAGPERLSGDWWSEPFRRDYWRGASARGELLVYAENGKWFVQGWYD
jgi:hypothetical protein